MLFRVAVDRISYYEIQAETEDEAIDAVLEGQGKELNQETVDAYVVEGDE